MMRSLRANLLSTLVAGRAQHWLCCQMHRHRTNERVFGVPGSHSTDYLIKKKKTNDKLISRNLALRAVAHSSTTLNVVFLSWRFFFARDSWINFSKYIFFFWSVIEECLASMHCNWNMNIKYRKFTLSLLHVEPFNSTIYFGRFHQIAFTLIFNSQLADE